MTPNSQRVVYRHCGLRVLSEIPLSWPEHPDPSGPEDVIIRVSAIDEIPHTPGANAAVSFCGSQLVLSVAEVGRYVARNGDEVLVDPAPHAREEDLRLYLSGVVFGALWHQRGVLPLHAAAVLVGRGCLLFAGRSGAGKSTLAVHLAKAGYPLVTDDVSVLTAPTISGLGVWPTNPHLKLTTESLRAIGEDPDALPHAGGTRGKRILAVDGVQGAATEPLPVHGFYLLDWHEGPPRVEPMTGLDAVDAIAGHTYCAEMVAPLGVRSRWLQQSALVSRLIPVRRLYRPRNLDELDAVVDVIMRDAPDPLHHEMPA